jgi:hypothetical protein
MTRRQDERGVTLILFALFLTAMLVFAALVLDSGLVFNQRRQNQSAVDAAALAALHELLDNPTDPQRYTLATDKAIEVTYTNITGDSGPPDAAWRARWLTCRDLNRDPGEFPMKGANPPLHPDDPCISFDADDTRVRVQLPEITIGSTFGQVVGIDAFTTDAEAEAEVTYGQPYALFGTDQVQSCDYAVTVRGASTSITGSVHSNEAIFFDASTSIAPLSRVTYVTPPAPTGAARVNPQPDPLSTSVRLSDYRPGGSKAVLAAGNYYDATSAIVDAGWLTANVNYDPVTGAFAPNDILVYTDRDVRLAGPLAGNITFVAEGQIELDDGQYDIRPWSGDPARLLALSTYQHQGCNQQAENAIFVGDASGRWDGVLYGPGAEIEIENTGAKQFNGMLVASAIDIDSDDVTVDSTSFAGGPPELRLRQ